MGKTSFSDANILNIFSGGSLLPGQWTIHTVCMCYLSNRLIQAQLLLLLHDKAQLLRLRSQELGLLFLQLTPESVSE